MDATVGAYVYTAIWTVVAYVACMLFDVGAHSRVGFAVISPPWAPAVKPTFWSGLAIRHVVLAPIAFLLQDLIRRHPANSEPEWVVLAALSVVYAALLMWDLIKYYVRPMWRARSRRSDL